MNDQEIASRVLSCVGGSANVTSNTLCMTRLRITIANPTLVDQEGLSQIPGVLGTVGRGPYGIEVVFGPKSIGGVYDAFSGLTSQGQADRSSFADLSHGGNSLNVRVTGAGAPARPTPAAIARELEDGGSEAQELERMLAGVEDDPDDDFADDASEEAVEPTDGPRLLVLNGPNINMLGIREPDLYGTEDFASLLELCHEAAEEEGFSVCRCYQSNHEGDLVDAIQDGYGRFDGIVINPGAYTHTSVAILDALKAVSIPAVEVHISKVDEREGFRQVSYVRAACFETVMGLGVKGYAKAIADLAAHLAKDEDDQ